MDMTWKRVNPNKLRTKQDDKESTVTDYKDIFKRVNIAE